MPNSSPNYTAGDLTDHHAIGALITNKQGEYLMFYHAKFSFWTIPIGKAEPGETPYQGLCTELKEECGIEVVRASEFATGTYRYIRSGRPVKVEFHLYEVHEFSGTPRNLEPHKHPDMTYMQLDTIRRLEDVSDGVKLFLQHAK